MKQKVVIIGHGSTSRLGIIRALGAVGCDITVIVMSWSKDQNKVNTKVPFDCYSKYVNRVLFNHINDADGLIALLVNHCKDETQKVVILPDSDFSAAVIDDKKDILKDYFVFPYVKNEPNSVRYWMDKDNQKCLAKTIGLNVAAAKTVNVSNGHYSIPQGIAYPCFTKALITTSGGGKQYFRKCNNAEELTQLLDFVATKSDTTILIEDFIDIDTEYALLGFSDGNNVFIPGVLQFLRNTQSHFGIAMTGKIMPIRGFKSIIELFCEFVKTIGFVGVFDIDFLYDGQKYYFDEMNLRFGGSGYAYTKMGINLPAILVDFLQDNKIETKKTEVRESATYVNERMCVDDWYRGFISTTEYHNILRCADISFVYDETDPLPSKHFDREFKLKRVKRLLKNLLRR